MALLLSTEELRVAGCLIEKQLATPQHYPLSEQALVTACNQTSNREPVVDYDQDDVRRALQRLRSQGLARTARRPGERVDKHEHRLDEALELDAAALAVLAVLLLRGPQTLGELRTRAERMHPFADLDEVQAVLDELGGRDEPLATEEPRRPGQKETRYAHRLGVTEDAAQQAASRGQPDTAPPDDPVGAGRADEPDAAPTPPQRDPEVAAAVADLQQEVAALRSDLEDLRRRLSRSPLQPPAKPPPDPDP